MPRRVRTKPTLPAVKVQTEAMEIFLVRHAKAEPGQDDAARRLTQKGREAAEAVARLLRRQGVSVARIEHSPLVRARETAEIIGRRIGSPLAESADLRPEADVGAVRQRLFDDPGGSVVLVGHNPFVGTLAGLLLAEDEKAAILSFHTGSVARLISVPSGLGWRFTCDWLITPALVSM